jgi:putative transposase
MLNGEWSGQTLLDWALRLLVVVVGGYLIVDDTVVEQPHAKRLKEAGWVWSSKRNKAVYGVSVVLLVWTDGQLRIPLGFRVWKAAPPNLSWP